MDITKCKDDDGHWYWIPNRLLCEFRNDFNEIVGKDYMDCPDYFDSFEEKYDKYRTHGDSDNIPSFFKQNKNKCEKCGSVDFKNKFGVKTCNKCGENHYKNKFE